MSTKTSEPSSPAYIPSWPGRHADEARARPEQAVDRFAQWQLPAIEIAVGQHEAGWRRARRMQQRDDVVDPCAVRDRAIRVAAGEARIEAILEAVQLLVELLAPPRIVERTSESLTALGHDERREALLVLVPRRVPRRLRLHDPRHEPDPLPADCHPSCIGSVVAEPDASTTSGHTVISPCERGCGQPEEAPSFWYVVISSAPQARARGSSTRRRSG